MEEFVHPAPEQSSVEPSLEPQVEPQIEPIIDDTESVEENVAPVEPMCDIELSNIHLELSDTDAGVQVSLMAQDTEHFNPSSGYVSDDLRKAALAQGLDDATIDSFMLRQQTQIQDELNIILGEVGLNEATHQDLITQAKESFTSEEWSIFVSDVKRDPVTGLKALKEYLS